MLAHRSGLTGKEVAEDMLKYYNIHDVRVVQGQGMLTDHYNPKTKTVSLSPDVYNGRNVSAAAVASIGGSDAIAAVPVNPNKANIRIFEYFFI